VDPKEGTKKLEEMFGSRESALGFMLVELSTHGQPCDVTFYHREPILNVRVDQQLGLALMYGAGPKKIQQLMNAIKFSDGTTASLMEIWTVNPMPQDGFTEEQLAAVDLREAEQKVGQNGETLRQMIRESYHCKTRAEEDKFLRRFIAS